MVPECARLAVRVSFSIDFDNLPDLIFAVAGIISLL
jgi:hypothetical protein